MSTDPIFDRAYGCLLGQAIGDALGTRYEFENASVTKSSIKTDLREQKSSFLPILGGGPFNMEPGQVTDDTEMAMALARSLQRLKKFHAPDVARSYAIWFYSSPPDIGITTCNAFVGLPGKLDEMKSLPEEKIYGSILETSAEKNKSSLSNGCLMRISPLAIAGSHWPLDSLRDAAVADCRITHPNPVAHDAVAAYVTAIWYLINTGDRQKAYDETIARVQTPEIRRILEIDDDPSVPIIVHKNGGQEEIKKIDGDAAHMGFLGVALKWAFYELRKNGDDFEKALVSVISRGGDTDTNGCITGALLGAYAGASKIPASWKSTVLGAKPRRLRAYDWVNMSDAEALTADLLKAAPPSTST